MRLLVTGGAGFVGSHYVKLARMKRPGDLVVTLDVTSSHDPPNLRELKTDDKHVFYQGNIQNKNLVLHILKIHDIQAILNFAAQTNVDKSVDPNCIDEFLGDNINGTMSLLSAATQHRIRKFIQISTDEVYGPAPEGWAFSEEVNLNPRNPYAATKASADHLALSYHHTHSIPVVVTRSSSNYGPRQHPDNFIPAAIRHALARESIPLHGDGNHKRGWIHVSDNCEGIDRVLMDGQAGEIYNVGTRDEFTDSLVVQTILAIVKRYGIEAPPPKRIQDRLAHDRRRAIDSNKLTRQVGWKPAIGFRYGLEETVEWYRDNKEWANEMARRTA
jgi:dTDP-glucose 4,6-dehydratase